MQPLFDMIVRQTDAFCAEYLDNEYRELCRELSAALCRKRPSPIRLANLDVWACGVVYAIGSVNFLFDRTQTPHISAAELCKCFGVSKSTAAARAKLIRDLFHMRQADPRWWRPSQLGDNPLAWFIDVDGLTVDARTAPRGIQEEAYRLGLIPFLPGQPAPDDDATKAGLIASRLEEMAGWCAHSTELASVRRRAKREFFGTGRTRAEYWPGSGGRNARQRRFVGWLMLGLRLPDGRRPAELAAAALYTGADLADALAAIQGSRQVLGIVDSTDGRQRVAVELEDERFVVCSATWAQGLTAGAAVIAHLVPAGRNVWVPGPGWLAWPLRVGANMRRELKRFQPDPIQVERLLQHRAGGDGPSQPYPRDATLEDAVARLTAAAKTDGRSGLVMSTEEWRSLILEQMAGPDLNAFVAEIMGRVGRVGDADEMNRWLALANNIWNATPQPDRGGQSAYELIAQDLLPL
jgi:hypothetical protein